MTNVLFQNTNLPDIIELRNVSQQYGDVVIIDGLNLLIEEKPGYGQINVVLGPSGCGKSSILRYIAGLQTPSSGEIFLYQKLRTEKNHVGMVFQQYSSFPWLSVFDNISISLVLQRISKKERYDKTMEMIQFCDLEKHKGKFAQYPILSGGQLQRVAIARSLVANPNILLLDEPFGALDINTRLKMQDMLLRIQNQLKPTLIFVTHDISEAVYLANNIYIMSANPGQIQYHIKINLPVSERTRIIKRDSTFMQYIYQIEDIMMNLQQQK